DLLRLPRGPPRPAGALPVRADRVVGRGAGDAAPARPRVDAPRRSSRRTGERAVSLAAVVSHGARLFRSRALAVRAAHRAPDPHRARPAPRKWSTPERRVARRDPGSAVRHGRAET